MERRAVPDERLVLQQIAAGDEKAFATIVQHYWRNIYGQALVYVRSPQEAQDIVQEVFVKVWEKRARLMEVEKFDAWLYIIARNHIISQLRKKIAEPLAQDITDHIAGQEAMPDKQLAFKQLQQHIEEAVKALPPQQKTAWQLSRDQGLTFEAIARQMGLSRETVKKHIGRALNTIRTYVGSRTGIKLLAPICCTLWRLLK